MTAQQKIDELERQLQLEKGSAVDMAQKIIILCKQIHKYLQEKINETPVIDIYLLAAYEYFVDMEKVFQKEHNWYLQNRYNGGGSYLFVDGHSKSRLSGYLSQMRLIVKHERYRKYFRAVI